MAANAPPSVSVDEGGEIVLNRFYDFLAKFTSSAEGTTDGTDGVQLYRDYLAQIAAMVENEKNTVYVDVQHVFAVGDRSVLCLSVSRMYGTRSYCIVPERSAASLVLSLCLGILYNRHLGEIILNSPAVACTRRTAVFNQCAT